MECKNRSMKLKGMACFGRNCMTWPDVECRCTLSRDSTRNEMEYNTIAWHVGYMPSKHGTFTQCCFNVGPPSATLAQHWNNIGWTSRVCWVVCKELVNNASSRFLHIVLIKREAQARHRMTSGVTLPCTASQPQWQTTAPSQDLNLVPRNCGSTVKPNGMEWHSM